MKTRLKAFLLSWTLTLISLFGVQITCDQPSFRRSLVTSRAWGPRGLALFCLWVRALPVLAWDQRPRGLWLHKGLVHSAIKTSLLAGARLTLFPVLWSAGPGRSLTSRNIAAHSSLCMCMRVCVCTCVHMFVCICICEHGCSYTCAGRPEVSLKCCFSGAVQGVAVRNHCQLLSARCLPSAVLVGHGAPVGQTLTFVPVLHAPAV